MLVIFIACRLALIFFHNTVMFTLQWYFGSF